MTMESLFAETTALMHGVNAGLAQLERAATSGSAYELEASVSGQLGSIGANVERLEGLVSKEPLARRRTSKYRLDQLAHDAAHLRTQMGRLAARAQQRFRAEAEREELLSRRFPAASDTALLMDDGTLQENDRLRESHAHMDGIIEQSRAILSNLKDQGGYLGGVRKKMLEVAQTLGMSNTVLRLIERRTAQDRMILFGGMAITLILMYVIYRGFKA